MEFLEFLVQGLKNLYYFKDELEYYFIENSDGKLVVMSKNPGEDARLYKAVEVCSDFACSLGINIPTGKDSLSMTQKYGDEKVFSPGTVIIFAAGEVTDVKKT